jgi:hypothetical protein
MRASSTSADYPGGWIVSSCGRSRWFGLAVGERGVALSFMCR